MDIVDKATRSRMMSGIRGRNTRPEIMLRRALHSRGLRFRLHSHALPGKPDIILAKYKAALFVHGCFWHRHAGCRLSTMPATRPEFWAEKFEGNVARDQRVHRDLIAIGWRVATIWECSLRKPSDIEKAASIIESWLSDMSTYSLEIGSEQLGLADQSRKTVT